MSVGRIQFSVDQLQNYNIQDGVPRQKKARIIINHVKYSTYITAGCHDI